MYLKNKLILFITLLFIAGISLWLLGINEPFTGSYGAADTYLALASKNYLRFGLIRLKFLPTYFVGGELPADVNYYLHHPILAFLLNFLAFKLFGMHNWVVRVIPTLLSLGAVLGVYKVTRLLWNKKTACLSSIIAALVPMMTVYGNKQQFFELTTLPWTIAVVYFFLKYLKSQQKKYLRRVFLFSLLASLSDWGALYLLPFLPLFYLLGRIRAVTRAYLYYIMATALGIGVFLILVLVGKGGFQDLVWIYKIRTVNNELFALSWPYLRLIFLSLIRIVVYFSPPVALLSFLSLALLLKNFLRKNYSLQNITLLLFLLFGITNIFLFPTSTWGHIYFLFYLIPFMSISSAVIIAKMSRKAIVVICLSLLIWSSAVTFFKWKQRNKTVWRYYTAKTLVQDIKAYQPLGVYGFPGDLLEYYFDHPTVPLNSLTEIISILETNNHPVVFSCWDACTPDEEDFIYLISNQYEVNQYQWENKKTWLITADPAASTIEPPAITPATQKKRVTREDYLLLNLYRRLRDFLQVGQL